MSDTKKYQVLVGLDYSVEGEDKRAEVGDVVADLPPESVKWLQDGGYIEVVRPSRKRKVAEKGGTGS